MDIRKAYQLLNIAQGTPDRAVAAAYKKLALKYHPDKNRDRPEWANEAMTELNIAYSLVTSHRFESGADAEPEEQQAQKPAPEPDQEDEEYREDLIQRFAAFKDRTRDPLYQYFQYQLYNPHRRDTHENTSRFNRIARQLQRAYHSVNGLKKKTRDPD